MMADYECYPLWLTTSAGTRNLNPKELTIPDVLAQDLLDWADAYDATLNHSDPSASGFADSAAEDAFYARGRELARELAAQLGSRFTVEYVDTPEGRS